MSPFAANLSDTDMADLAAFYVAQRPTPRPAATDPSKVAAGRELAIVPNLASDRDRAPRLSEPWFC